MKGEAIGILNFHSSPEISPLTDSRPLGSTSFLGRYAFCDFALSTFCNSDISTVGLLVKDHQRSILKHLRSMDAWVHNTKIGQEIIMYNEPAQRDASLNTDIQNIRENDWVLYDSTASYIVIVPAHILCPIDLRVVLKEHIASRSKITVVATKIEDKRTAYFQEWVLTPDKEGNVADAHRNSGKEKGPGLMSMGIVVINRTTLAELIRRFLPENPKMDLGELIAVACKETGLKRKIYLYEGFSRCIDTFEHYVSYSFEMLNLEFASKLFLPSWPIYTLTHDTPPALYDKKAECRNSFVSNGAIIEGVVENSIIARNVRVSPGAVVRNSIIFSNTRIGEGVIIENMVIDKYAIITRNQKITAPENKPGYLKQGAIV